jgi:hypothetical protein
MIARAIAGVDRLSPIGEDGSEAPKGLRQAQPERQTRAVRVAVAVQRPYEVSARR